MINSDELLKSAKVYSFNTLHALGMMPTDIDAVHEKDGQFTFFEFKCSEGMKSGLKAGQRRMWETLLRELGEKALLLVCVHGDVRGGVTDPLKALESIQVWQWDGTKVAKSQRLSPEGGTLEWVLSLWRSDKRTELKNWLAGSAE